MEECNWYAVKLSPQSFLVKSLCLMVYSCKNAESDLEVNMTEVPIVYGPLSSFIDQDDQVDLELACLSNMSVTIIFPQTSKFPRSYWISFWTFLLWKKLKLMRKNINTWLQSMVQALLKNHSLFNCYHLDMSTSSKFMMLWMASSLHLNLMKIIILLSHVSDTLLCSWASWRFLS